MVRDAWRRERGQMVVLPTGVGKTIFGLSLVADVVAAGHRVVWLAHRRELLTQPLAALNALWPDIEGGVVQGSTDDAGAQVVFGSVDTLRNPERLARVTGHGYPMLVVVDECHHSRSRTHSAVIAGLSDPERHPYMLGLTATPERGDRGDLSLHWTIAYHYPITHAIEEGYLVPPRWIVDRVNIDLTAIGGREDYDEAELGAALLLAGIVDHTAEAMGKHVKGRTALVFTVTVEQATQTASALNASGWRAAVVSGDTPQADRARILEGVKAGTIDAVCNCAVLTEGTDLPIVDTVVIARPTRFKGLYIQMVGRGLRLYPGKTDCIVLDLAGASNEHDLIQAPVLIGGECDHAWIAPGECAECGQKCACWQSPTGAHDYGSKPVCRWCEKVQCEGSPDMRHAWRAEGDGMKTCNYCDVQVSDSLIGMKARRQRPQPAMWHKVNGSLVCDVGSHGLVILRQSGTGWEPLWYPKRARNPRPLCVGAVSIDLAHGLADDLVRRATPLNKPGASWRDKAPSAKQLAYADRLGCHVPSTAGECSDMIVTARAKRLLS